MVPRRPGRLLLVVLAVTSVAALALGSLAGCASDDDDDGSSGAEGGGEFTLTSSAFDEGEPIPDAHTPVGGDTSPPLSWSGVPEGTEELALTVVDPDANNFVHWVVWGLDPAGVGLEAGAVPAAATEGLNQFGETGWAGPQPPAGEEHTYVFTLHALPRAPTVTEATPAAEAVELIEELATEQAELRGQYTS